MDFWQIIEVIALPAIGAVAGWLGNAKKQAQEKQRQDNEFLRDMQASINLLADENRKLMAEVVELRKENAAMRTEIGELKHKLENVKTITRKA
jgi:lipopolysaccharide biosynthesis regulator YciM